MRSIALLLAGLVLGTALASGYFLMQEKPAAPVVSEVQKFSQRDEETTKAKRSAIIGQELRINDVMWRIAGPPDVVYAEGAKEVIGLNITLLNDSKEARQFDYRQMRLIDSRGREYSPSESRREDSRYSWFEPGMVNPGVYSGGYVEFDVAADAEGLELELYDVPYLANADKKADHVGYIELKF